jgi:hypothetical protein
MSRGTTNTNKEGATPQHEEAVKKEDIAVLAAVVNESENAPVDAIAAQDDLQDIVGGSETGETEAETKVVPPKEPEEPEEPEEPKYVTIDPNALIGLENRSPGRLIYRSLAGYQVVWAGFGDVADVPFSEVSKMRNERPAFFKNGWVVPISGNANEIIVALQLDRYYDNAHIAEDFDTVFKLSPDEFKKRVTKMSVSQREVVALRASVLIKDGKIDSAKLIKAISEATGLDLGENS